MRTDELFPLLPGETLPLTGAVPAGATATLWSERVRPAGAEAVASYGDGPLKGVPAVTRHTPGDGTAWYLATRPGPETLGALLTRVCAEADYLFLIDHGGDGAEVPAGPHEKGLHERIAREAPSHRRDDRI